MKTQIKVTKIQENKIDITTLSDRKSIYLLGQKEITLRIVFPDDAFWMEITFPMEGIIKSTEKNIMKILKARLLDMNDVIFTEL